MTEKKVPQKFSATARIVIISSIEVSGKTFEDALASAKNLKVADFVTVDGEYIDGSIRLVNVSADDMWKTDDY